MGATLLVVFMSWKMGKVIEISAVDSLLKKVKKNLFSF